MITGPNTAGIGIPFGPCGQKGQNSQKGQKGVKKGHFGWFPRVSGGKRPKQAKMAILAKKGQNGQNSHIPPTLLTAQPTIPDPSEPHMPKTPKMTKNPENHRNHPFSAKMTLFDPKNSHFGPFWAKKGSFWAILGQNGHMGPYWPGGAHKYPITPWIWPRNHPFWPLDPPWTLPNRGQKGSKWVILGKRANEWPKYGRYWDTLWPLLAHMAHTAKTPKKPGFSPFLTLFHPLSTPGQAWPKYPPQQGINGPLHSYLTPFGTPGQKGQKVVILDPLFDPFLALLALLARRAQYMVSW